MLLAGNAADVSAAAPDAAAAAADAVAGTVINV